MNATGMIRIVNFVNISLNLEHGNDNRYSMAPSCLSLSNIDQPVNEAYRIRKTSNMGAR
jgi:hypothetical protein